MELRNLTLILFLVAALTSQAQQTLTISDSPRTFTKRSLDNKPVIQLSHGQITGDYSEMDEKDFINVTENGFMIKDSDQPITFTSELIPLNKVNRIAFTAFLSGTGSLDDYGILHDWIDVNYLLDGQRVKLGIGAHTLNAKPTDVTSGWIITKGHQTFQIEVTMKVTGDDETYTLERIELELDELNENSLLYNSAYTIAGELVNAFAEAFSYGPTEIAAENPTIQLDVEIDVPTTIQLQESTLQEPTIEGAPSITVYPNPTSNQLFLKYEEQYDLTKIELLSLKGQLLETATYPVDLMKYPAGMYFIRVATLEGEIMTAPFTIARK